MSRFDLLPPNSTQLERDLSRVTSSLERTGRPVPIIRTAKRKDIPDSVVPWLIFEYGLGEILPYLGNNQRRALEEGVLWQRIRGTPESVRIALGWIGIDGYIEESARGMQRWAEYQLGLSAATADDVIDSIAGVARISSPVRSRLQRIYAVYDRRRFVLNKSLLSGGDMLSDHSGVRLRPDWPQISYGNVVIIYVQRSADEIDISGAHTQCAGALIRRADRFILNETKIGEAWHKRNYPFVMSEQIGISGKYEGQVAGYFLPLPMIPADVNVIVHTGIVEATPSYLDVWPTTGPSMYSSMTQETSSPPPPPPPQLTLVTSRAGLNGNDYLDWGGLGDPWDSVEHPFTINTNLGTSVTVTMASGNSFLRIDASNPDPWQGQFAIGDKLLYTDTIADYINAISLVFSGGVDAAGVNIQPTSNGPFVARVAAFGAGDAPLGSFDVNGYADITPGTATFVGVRSPSTANQIFRVEFSILSADATKAAFAINRVEVAS